MTEDYDKEYYEELTQHRYIFTVRQKFGEGILVDTFYKLQVPSGLTGDQAKIMIKLNKDWNKRAISADTSALSGMQLRLRFNTDTFQKVCLIRTACEITADDLNTILLTKQKDGTLMQFLEESSV